MTSTSAYRGFEIPTVSSDSGTWGTLLNDTIEYVDSILGQTTTLPSTTYGTDITLSSSQARCVRIDVTSVSTAEFTIHLMSSCYAQGLYVVKNNTGGDLTCQSNSTANVVTISANRSNVVVSDGVGVHPAVTTMVPTVTVATSGSGTYYTKAGCALLKVRLVGGGGGGAGSGTGAGAAGSGGATTFDTLAANGGDAAMGASPGGGGSASGGYFNKSGSAGCPGSGQTNEWGGVGGAGTFGGGGRSGRPNMDAGGAATDNSGAGGGGAGCGATPNSGAGGGAGAYCEGLIVDPISSYAYSIGDGGTAGGAGVGGMSGGAGGSGVAIIEEYY